MKKQLFCFAIILVHFSANAQSMRKNALESKNAIYLSLLGEGTLSAHYNRMLYEKREFFVDGKIGIGLVSGRGESIGKCISHSVSANFGQRHSLELGFGGTYYQASANFYEEEDGYGLYPIMGYKFRSASSRFTFRVSTHPMKPNLSVTWPISVSFGLAF
ncbi:MAG: hypothetical protein H7246_00515 [Phycisphaerae bacterium]|nr:hypothetical protein [Saprospiraceae bacterium]